MTTHAADQDPPLHLPPSERRALLWLHDAGGEGRATEASIILGAFEKLVQIGLAERGRAPAVYRLTSVGLEAATAPTPEPEPEPEDPETTVGFPDASEEG